MSSYIPGTEEERRGMLETIGVGSVEELFASVPASVRLEKLNIPAGKSEAETAEEIRALAEKNLVYRTVFRGAGSYRHYIPSIVKTITSKEEFVTAYTPYQAEISQGVLQSIFEYQTQICELTGMDVSNASLYDGATAAAEAVFMCEDRKHTGVLLSAAVDPGVQTVMGTYCESRSVNVTLLPLKDYATDLDALEAALTPSLGCVYVQSPNYYGIIEDVEKIVELAHAKGVKVIVGANPISLGLLKTPGACGADVCVGEGQPLGLSTAFGGPYLGFMACKTAMTRQLPGRIVGETTDAQGRRAYVLTLQAREQHIRREKASSNVCSNEALCAMTASVYLAAVGPKGLRKAALNSASNARYLQQELAKLGFELKSGKTFFHEFYTTCPVCPEQLQKALDKKGILGGLPVGDGMLWCCTELNNKAKIDELIAVIGEVCA